MPFTRTYFIDIERLEHERGIVMLPYIMPIVGTYLVDTSKLVNERGIAIYYDIWGTVLILVS